MFPECLSFLMFPEVVLSILFFSTFQFLCFFLFVYSNVQTCNRKFLN